MVDEAILRAWFCREVLPLEPSLTSFIRRNWRVAAEVADLRQDIYERALGGARAGLPTHTRQYLFTVARNHLISRAKRGRVISLEFVADVSAIEVLADRVETDRTLSARDELRRAQRGLDQLPPRCREIVWLRKVEGLSTRETAERLGISAPRPSRSRSLTGCARWSTSCLAEAEGSAELRFRAETRGAGLDEQSPRP